MDKLKKLLKKMTDSFDDWLNPKEQPEDYEYDPEYQGSSTIVVE
jgi:hypothetical protein